MGAGRRGAGREHGGVFEFLGTAAAHADQVVVVAVLGVACQLEAAAPIRELQFLQQVQGAQQPQGAVHRGQGDPAIAAAQPLVHVLGAEVAAGADLLEQGQHPLPLGGEALAPFMQAGAQAVQQP